MQELLPFGAGLVFGLLLMLWGGPRSRWFSLPVVCVPLGALFSWINGELGTSIWPLFVSFDALLVWAGAVLVLTTDEVRRRVTA